MRGHRFQRIPDEVLPVVIYQRGGKCYQTQPVCGRRYLRLIAVEILSDKAGGQISSGEFRMIQDQIDKIQIGYHPFNMIPVQGIDQRHPGAFPRISPTDDFRQ